MAIPYIQSSLASVNVGEGSFVNYPFLADGDSDTKVYTMICSQLASDYNASELDLDDTMSSASAAGVNVLPFPADNKAYFVGDTNLQPATGGFLTFTRTFANIPKITSLPSGSELVKYPGILNGNLNIDALESYEGGLGQVDGLWITTSAPNSLSVGDKVELRNIAYNTFNETTGEPEGSGDLYVSTDDEWTSVTVREVSSTTRFRIIDLDLDWTGLPTLEPTSGEARNPESLSYNISDVSLNLGAEGLMITTSEVHSIDVGQRMEINMQFTEGLNPYVHSINGQFEVLSIPSTTTFVVDVGYKWNGFPQLTLKTGAKTINTGLKRPPITRNATTRTRYQYILPGVTTGINDENDIVIPEPFRVMDTYIGEPVETTRNFSYIQKRVNNTITAELTTPTMPTSTDYIRMVSEGANIILESSVSKWAGNIMVMKIKTCQAK